jgi:autotransporter-associated beta strand protein
VPGRCSRRGRARVISSGIATFAILTGGNIYSGSTTIQAGTLRLGNGISSTSLSAAAAVMVAACAMHHLDYSGTDVIGELRVDDLQIRTPILATPFFRKSPFPSPPDGPNDWFPDAMHECPNFHKTPLQ